MPFHPEGISRLDQGIDIPPPDYGPDGEAFTSRPSSIQTVGAEDRGYFKKGGVDARVMRDSTVHDTMLALTLITQAQWDAADKLYAWFAGGGFQRPCTGGYGERVGGASLYASDDDEEKTSADEYRALLRRMPSPLAAALDTLMCQQWDRRINEALDWCVREWRL